MIIIAGRVFILVKRVSEREVNLSIVLSDVGIAAGKSDNETEIGSDPLDVLIEI